MLKLTIEAIHKMSLKELEPMLKPNLPNAKFARACATHPDYNVVLRVALSELTHPKVLEELAVDKRPGVVFFVASNRSTPEEVLMELAWHKDPHVVRRVAGNTKSPPFLLKELANHKRLDVRAAVLRNPKTPADVQERLKADPDVVKRAKKQAEFTARLKEAYLKKQQQGSPTGSSPVPS